MANIDGSMDWNDVIESDGAEFVLLPEDDYNFTVTGFERGRFAGSAKTPACNKAVLTLEIPSPKGTAYITTDLILHKNFEWKLAAFFRSIGQKKHGEKLTMDWGHVLGAKGRCFVIQRDYVNRNGENRTTNDIDRFLDPEPEDAPAGSVKGYDDIPF